MNVKTLFSTVFIAAATLLASCDNDVLTADSGNNPDPVRFTSRIATASETRVATDASGNSLWEKDDPVGIFMVNHGAATPVSGAVNVAYKAASAGSNTSFVAAGVTSIAFPTDETVEVDFIAYYPYSASVADFIYPVNVADQSSQAALDLLYAKADNSGKGYTKQHARDGKTVDYVFDHQLVKLSLDIELGFGGENISAVCINGMNTTAKFDLATGTLSDFGNPAAITPAGSGFEYEAVLLPVDALTDAHTVTFTVDGTNYTWKMGNDITSGKLDGEHIYTYTLTIHSWGVSVKGNINSWEEGDSGYGYVEQI